jgi:hypothetical protein
VEDAVSASEPPPVDLVDAVFQECMRLTPDAPPGMARMFAEALVKTQQNELAELVGDPVGDLDNWQPRGILS